MSTGKRARKKSRLIIRMSTSSAFPLLQFRFEPAGITRIRWTRLVRTRSAPSSNRATDRQTDDDTPAQDGDERQQPSDPLKSPTRRREQYPLAIAADEVVADLIGTLPILQLIMDHLAHLRRHLRRRIGHRKILTHGTTQLGRQPKRLLFQTAGERHARPCPKRDRQQQPHDKRSLSAIRIPHVLSYTLHPIPCCYSISSTFAFSTFA